MSDWSSDVCPSDLVEPRQLRRQVPALADPVLLVKACHHPRWPSPQWRRWTIGTAAIILTVGASVTIAFQPSAPATSAKGVAASLILPTNPEIAANFLTARDLVVDRKAPGLERAIPLLDNIIRSDPPDRERVRKGKDVA